jgi:NhaP-type Na+/H+ or K+/H+ antiporter
MTADPYILLLLGLGAVGLLVSWAPIALARLPMSLAIICVALGIVMFSTGTLSFNPDPRTWDTVTERLAELVVIVSLMGAGLKLDRPLGWRRWGSTWRLLGIAMPLTIAASAWLGVAGLGFPLAMALLLGAAMAPTDPVLAADVQVGPPRSGDEDEVRFGLTSEAGLNDGLAFPFVHLALLLIAGGFTVADVGTWIGWYVVGKIALGLAIGLAVGWVLGREAFHSRSDQLRLAEHGEPLLALAALLTAYGAAELVGGYGFLAVFACAMRVRAAERGHSYQRAMHGLIERLERLMTLLVLLVLGMAMTRGLLEHLDWRGVAVALALVLLVRPVAGYVALAVRPRDEDLDGGLDRGEAAAVAFFGVRGVGSLYYLAYATSHEHVPDEPWLWSTVAFTVIVSVLLHGVTATPAMSRLDARRGLTSTRT